jgi:hypothetical protein
MYVKLFYRFDLYSAYIHISLEPCSKTCTWVKTLIAFLSIKVMIRPLSKLAKLSFFKGNSFRSELKLSGLKCVNRSRLHKYPHRDVQC